MRIAAAVLLLAAAARAASPEEPATPKPDATDVDELYTRLFPGTVPEDVGAVGEPQEEARREGLGLGPVTLLPSLMVSYVDGDNVFLDSAQPTRDRYVVVQPNLGLRMDALTFGAGTFRISYEPRFRFGSSYEELLDPSHQVDALLELPLTPGLTLRAADHFFVGTVETTEVDPGREYFFGLGRFGRNQVDAGLRIETGGRLGLDLAGSVNRVVFDEESSFFDYDQDRVSLALQYELTPNTRLGLKAGLERVPGIPERPESRMHAETYGLVLDGDIAPLTTGTIEVGYREQENPDAAPGGTLYRGAYASASVAREFSRGGRLNLGVVRATPLSAFEENGFYVSTGVLGALTFPLPLALSASAGASYQWNDYRTPAAELAAPREDRIFGWSVGLGRPLTRWCFVRVDYRQDRRDSNVPSLSNTAHGLIAQLGVGWFGGRAAVSLLPMILAVLLQGAPPSTPASPAPAADEYRVGPGDVLDVVVFGNDDLSRAAPVQTDGTVNLPLLGEVPVAGLTVAEAQRKVTTLLARDYLVKPQVEIRVREYQSQAVTVLGEVNSPGRKVLKGRTRLIDMLVESGGFTPRASGEVSVSRSDGTFAGGEATLTLRLGGALDPVQRVNLEIPLRNGDIVTASAKAYVTVEGEVNRPGRYTIDEDLTVTGAVTLAGGLTRFGSNDLRVRRLDPGSGKVQILEVDLKAVRKGKVPDLKLLANDVVTVSRRLF